MPDTITARRHRSIAQIKRRLYRSPTVRNVYARLRSPLDRRQGATLFVNPDVYVRALHEKANGQALLRTHDGLQIAIRRNTWDAEIVREIYFMKPYTEHLPIGPAPVVVDIGGYIGDFTLYAMKYLGASRVIVCEPTRENYDLILRNIELNGYGDEVVALNLAVGVPGELTLYVQKLDRDEVHASTYWYADEERRTVPSVSLEQLLDEHGVQRVDLLKIDCEGGEYDILSDVPAEVLRRIRNIAFEYHEVDDFEPKLARIMNQLTAAGFTMQRPGGHIVLASRS